MHHMSFAQYLRRRIALFWALSLVIPATSQTLNSGALAALQQGGHVLVMRHAQTVPGIGDPPNFKIGDCSTQRNLSDAGRDSARALGGQLQKANVKFDMVETSAWCRCVDTAKLVFKTAPQVYAPINSTFNDRSTQPNRTDEVQKRIRNWRGAGNLALVTHMVNIQSLTGEVLGMNEVIVLKPSPTEASGFKIIGRLAQ
jgi:phosphohistidine phosphatase SixA